MAALRTFVPNWSNGKLKAAFDLHCPHIRGPHNEVIYIVGSADERCGSSSASSAGFSKRVQSGPLVYRASDNLPFGQAWNTGGNTGSGKSFGQWAGGLEGIRLAASFEIPYANAGGQAGDGGQRPCVRAESGQGPSRLSGADRRKRKTAEASSQPVRVNGVFPKLTVMAKGMGSNSEAGIGALIPWAQKLWAVGYVAHISGQGLGLYEISDDMTMRRHPASVTGTFANRMPHWPSGQAFIGPYAIDADGNVRVIEDLKRRSPGRHVRAPDRPGEQGLLPRHGRAVLGGGCPYAGGEGAFRSRQGAGDQRPRRISRAPSPPQGRVVVANNTL